MTDDPMTQLMAANDELIRRLGAYGQARLSPDLATSARMRARVLAVAHRRAALARADAGLAVLPVPDDGPHGSTSTSAPQRLAGTTGIAGLSGARRRLLAAGLAAALVFVAVTGTAFAARAGGPLYGARLWIEAATLPADPSSRALAELDRLEARLGEALEASAAGDGAAAEAALAAYEAIVEGASTAALVAGDAVATAALEAGLAHNLAVLEALAARLPEQASDGLTRAMQRAIEHSGRALDSIGRSGPDPDRGGSDKGGAGGGRPDEPGGRASHQPAATPDDAKPDTTPKPTKEPEKGNEKPAAPSPAPTPDREPPGGQPGGPPDDPGGGNGGG
jgi:hypothetical protein